MGGRMGVCHEGGERECEVRDLPPLCGEREEALGGRSGGVAGATCTRGEEVTAAAAAGLRGGGKRGCGRGGGCEPRQSGVGRTGRLGGIAGSVGDSVGGSFGG